VLGGYLTYRLGREGGKDTLEKKLPKDKAEKVYKKFEEKGFWAIAVPALLPPPVPIVPFLLAAGAMQYSRKKFLASLAVGRGIRFTVVAFIAAHFGTEIFKFFSKYYKPALYSLIALAVLGGLAGLWWYLRYRQKHSRGKDRNKQANRSERKVA
jgi:membrane protein DedA with SNARE-associated domain